jgi:hypothetical protein
MSAAADTRRIALNIARNNGWPVFPLGENKRPTWSKDDGGRGFHDASADPEQINRLWREHPGSLVGVPTGKPSGFSVIDIDIKHDEARAWWRQHQHLLPTTRTYRTRSGGLHLYFRHSDGVKNSQGDLTLGVDTRGDGGYVVFWFAAGCECVDHSPMAAWPHWVSRTLWPPPKPKPEYRRSNVRELPDDQLERVKQTAIDMVSMALNGQKHVCVRNAARLLGGIQASAGFTDSEAERWLVDALNGRADDPHLARRTIAWGLQSGRSAPLEGCR